MMAFSRMRSQESFLEKIRCCCRGTIRGKRLLHDARAGSTPRRQVLTCDGKAWQRAWVFRFLRTERSFRSSPRTHPKQELDHRTPKIYRHRKNSQADSELELEKVLKAADSCNTTFVALGRAKDLTPHSALLQER